VETWDAIRSRRNVRAYAEEAIAPEHLDQVLEAARRSADHVARSAATIALVAPRSDDARTRDLIQYDLGQVTMSIMVAAADLGIGSAHSAVADQDLARRLLGFPEDRLCAWLISLGLPADRPLTPIQRPNRRPFTDVVHRGIW
jgi:nitroreductase